MQYSFSEMQQTQCAELAFTVLLTRLSSHFCIEYLFEDEWILWNLKEALAKILDHSTFCHTSWGDRFVRFVVYFNKVRAEKNPVALGMIAHNCYEKYLNAISKIIIYKSNTSCFSSVLEKNASTLKFKLMIMTFNLFTTNPFRCLSIPFVSQVSLNVFSSFCYYIKETQEIQYLFLL